MECTAIEIKLNDGNGGFDVLRIATSPFDVVLNGDVYTATGDVLEISKSESTGEISKTGLNLKMTGIDPTFQTHLDAGGFIRAPITILTCLVPDGSNVVTVYEYYHRGFCDTPLTQVDYDTGTLTISLETNNVFTDIDKIPNLLRSSMASHSSRHPGDKFYQYTADVDVEETWKS